MKALSRKESEAFGCEYVLVRQTERLSYACFGTIKCAHFPVTEHLLGSMNSHSHPPQFNETLQMRLYELFKHLALTELSATIPRVPPSAIRPFHV